MATAEAIIIPSVIGPSNPVSITVVSSGMAGSAIGDTGIYSFPSQVGIGVVGLPQNALTVRTSTTAVSGAAHGIRYDGTLVAGTNGDQLRGLAILPTLTPGAFTGLLFKGILIGAQSVAGFTTAGDPVMVDIQALTGTGAINAFGIRITPPAGATNNYLISHTTPATFNVTAAGAITGNDVLRVTGGSTAPGIAANVLQSWVTGAPRQTFVDSSQAANARTSEFIFTAGSMRGRFIDDAYVGATNWIVVTGTSAAIASIALGGPLKLNNARAAGVLVQGGSVTMQDSTGATITVLTT